MNLFREIPVRQSYRRFHDKLQRVANKLRDEYSRPTARIIPNSIANIIIVVD